MVLVLPSAFDITAVEQLVVDLRLAVELGDVVLDATPVTRVDASALQLLCATSLAARARGHQLRWEARSAVVDDAVRVLGLDTAIGA